MADTKITALTALTAADPANDVIPIVDVSDTTMAASGTTKKISVNNILGASGTATLASATITGDLTVDTSTLKVDSANNRVGIGTASPQTTLDSAGTVTISGGTGTARRLNFDASGTYLNYIESAGTAGAGYMVFAAGNSEVYRIATGGTSTWSVSGTTAMTLNSTGLGVGASPSHRLTVSGTAATNTTGLGLIGTTTGYNRVLINNTSGGGQFGVEGSSGGNLCVGSTAYSTVVGSYQNYSLHFITNNTVQATLDASGNLLVGTTSTSGSSSNATTVVLGGSRSANGSVSATTAVASTIFSITGALRGRYEVVALIANSGNAALYTSIATILWDGNAGRVVANNGTNLTITLSGSDVQITQVSGSTQTVFWSFLRVAL